MHIKVQGAFQLADQRVVEFKQAKCREVNTRYSRDNLPTVEIRKFPLCTSFDRGF